MAIYTNNKNKYDDPTRYFHPNSDNRIYLCIDLKSFYASVECVERGLDPMTTNLIVADPARQEGTICLAVSPSMKKLGVKNRCRVFQIPKNIDYIMAPPQMQHYIDCSAEIYGVYLQYISKEDIHVYSIDEAFLDITNYLSLYKMTAKELGMEIMTAIEDRTGIRAACGIGTNLYLAKVALDITAKHATDFIGILTEDSYKVTLWDHQPLTDFWMIGSKTAKRLANYGIHTMRHIAHMDEEWIYRQFGKDGELLIDHAWGREPTTISDIKNYKSKSKALSSGQVLMRDYDFEEGKIIIKEMMDQLCLDLSKQGLLTNSITIHVGYSHNYQDPFGNPYKSAHGTASITQYTCYSYIWIEQVIGIYEKVVNPSIPIRRITICCNRIVPRSQNDYYQYSFFDSTSDLEHQTKERNIQTAMLQIKSRYGKNAILKGISLEDAATARERNEQIGGHRKGTPDI